VPRSINSIPVMAAFLAAFVSAALAAALSLTVLKAEAIFDKATGQPVISITFDAASTEAFAAFTRDNVGRETVVRIDGEEIMRPIIREPILKGTVQISGNMTIADAKDLAARLASGDAVIEVELVAE
jgi:preprotein translocase subunit SecD